MSKSQPQPWTIAKRAMPAEPSDVRSKSGNNTAAKRRIAAVTRWLHIYLSMISFVIVLFFAVTGLTLNHADWFDDQFQTNELTGKVPLAWVKTADTSAINKLGIVEHLRNTHGVKGAVSDMRLEADQVSVSFRGPGYTADAVVKRDNGTYQLTETRMGMVSILNDLHKGRDTGKSWSWAIDGSAIFMTLISATGLILLLFLKKRRTSGLLLAGIGFLIVYLIYAFALS
ncbi:PepSY-associated TM helix domain-containing protein [Spirosoma linguale]